MYFWYFSFFCRMHFSQDSSLLFINDSNIVDSVSFYPLHHCHVYQKIPQLKIFQVMETHSPGWTHLVFSLDMLEYPTTRHSLFLVKWNGRRSRFWFLCISLDIFQHFQLHLNPPIDFLLDTYLTLLFTWHMSVFKSDTVGEGHA